MDSNTFTIMPTPGGVTSTVPFMYPVASARRTKLPPTVRLFDQPLAIDEASLSDLLASDPQALAGYGRPTTRGYFVAEGVAVVPVCGTLMQRGTGMDELDAFLGICALDALRATLLAAAADGTANEILLDIDSGGGPVAGMFDFAAFVAKLNAQKPVTTYARRAMSAAYLMASATGRIVVPPNDPMPSVGSIGVLAVRRDVTAQDAAEGVAYHFVTSGAAKGDGFEHKAATDAELARLQALVDDAAGMFFAAVAEARDVTPAHVRGLEARTFRGQDALEAGLADAVMSFEDAILELATRPPTGAAPKGRGPMATEAQGAVVANIEDTPEFKAKVAAATAAANARASEIVDLCVLAGRPERATEMNDSGKSLEEIRKWAVAERATATTAASTVNANHPAPAVDPAAASLAGWDVTKFMAKRADAVQAAQAAHSARLH